jgi:hypothetical protein
MKVTIIMPGYYGCLLNEQGFTSTSGYPAYIYSMQSNKGWNSSKPSLCFEYFQHSYESGSTTVDAAAL